MAEVKYQGRVTWREESHDMGWVVEMGAMTEMNGRR
jgi:hypothetical protein